MFDFEIKMNKWRQMSKDRLDICEKCEHLDKKLYVCKECGCFMKAKTLLIGAECPIGKWGPGETVSNKTDSPK